MPKVAEQSCLQALQQVYDPELYVNIVDLGLIYEVRVTEAEGKSNIDVEMTMTSPACPAAPQIVREVKEVLGDIEEVGEVNVKVVLNPPWTPDRMTEEARDQLGMF